MRIMTKKTNVLGINEQCLNKDKDFQGLTGHVESQREQNQNS